MARPKKAQRELGSIAECDAAIRELLIQQLQLESLRADRDKEIAAIQATYESPIDKAVENCREITAQIQAFYMANVRQFEANGKRSLALANGVIGRRMSPPALKLLNRSWTWSAVLSALKSRFGGKYLRTREPEVDKDLVKAQLPAETLRECGLKLEQDETFFVEPFRPVDPAEAVQA